MSYNLISDDEITDEITDEEIPVKKLTSEEIKKILDFLNEFFNKYQEKLEAVNEGVSKSNYKELNDFYNHVYSKNWETDLKLAKQLYDFYNKHKTTIILSLRQILTKRQKTEIDEKIKNSKPFLKRVGNSNSDLSYESDSWFPLPPIENIDKKTIAKYKTSFIQPKSNSNPNVKSARDQLVEKQDVRLVNHTLDEEDKEILKVIPSNARNKRKALRSQILKYKYYFGFLPKPYQINLYDKDQGKKHYNRPGTWMFDIMYFSDFNRNGRNQAIYLVGININTRYAVGRRIKGKKADDLIEAFKNLLDNEFNQDKDEDSSEDDSDELSEDDMFNEQTSNKLNLLIFDGEKAISSAKFKEFCNNHNINVKITSPGIHTQTAPIDRLCRTLRDYYTKMYLLNLFQGVEEPQMKQLITDYKKNPIKNYKTFKEKMTTEALYARQMFDGQSSHYLPPIPIKYATCWNNRYLEPEVAKYYIIPNKDEEKFIKNLRQNHRYVTINDELYNVIDYYNRKPHHGLINILRKASSLFNLNFQIKNDEIILPISENEFYDEFFDDPNEYREKITPQFVNENKGLELIIIKYCQYYNKYIAKPSVQFNIGDKVTVYDCFTTERGKLLRNYNQILMGDWEIVEKDGEIYGVYDNVSKRLLHVSKYMIKPERT